MARRHSQTIKGKKIFVIFFSTYTESAQCEIRYTDTVRSFVHENKNNKTRLIYHSQQHDEKMTFFSLVLSITTFFCVSKFHLFMEQRKNFYRRVTWLVQRSNYVKQQNRQRLGTTDRSKKKRNKQYLKSHKITDIATSISRHREFEIIQEKNGET